MTSGVLCFTVCTCTFFLPKLLLKRLFYIVSCEVDAAKFQNTHCLHECLLSFVSWVCLFPSLKQILFQVLCICVYFFILFFVSILFCCCFLHHPCSWFRFANITPQNMFLVVLWKCHINTHPRTFTYIYSHAGLIDFSLPLEV